MPTTVHDTWPVRIWEPTDSPANVAAAIRPTITSLVPTFSIRPWTRRVS
jgi:hypothetical protein